MKSPTFWTRHYVTFADPAAVQGAIKLSRFPSVGANYELVCFPYARDAPNILISQGSGGHPYVFAELAYYVHLAGYNVFVMPKHGGQTVSELLVRHRDAL